MRTCCSDGSPGGWRATSSLIGPRPSASPLAGFEPEDVVAAVNAEMLRALRVISVERGHDPRDFALVAFGGAGPLHCELADELSRSRRWSSRARPASSPRSALQR